MSSHPLQPSRGWKPRIWPRLADTAWVIFEVEAWGAWIVSFSIGSNR